MNRKTSAGVMLLIALPFLSVFPALLLVLLGVSGPIDSICIGNASDAEGLLQACRNAGLIICALAAIGILITVIATIFSVRKLWAWEEGRNYVGYALKLGGIILLLELLLCGALLVKGPVFSVVADAQADLQQIKSGDLETETIWMYPGSAPAHLPGPYGAGHPSPLTKYYVAGGTLQSWEPYLFPNGLGFTTEPNKVYTSSKPKEWNVENVPRYEISYTSRLRFVVSVAEVNG